MTCTCDVRIKMTNTKHIFCRVLADSFLQKNWGLDSKQRGQWSND